MAKPNFLIVGVAKAGTTSLYHYLKKHPDVYMPDKKEIHFFDRYHYRGPNWYLNRFRGGEETQKIAVGEATPIYCFDPACMERIYDFNPEMKIIIALRNPTARAISHFWMSKMAQQEPLSMLKAMERNEEEIKSHKAPWQKYKSRGLYAEQLDRIYQYFPKDQVLVMQLENMELNPAESIAELCFFLGITPKLKFEHHFAGYKGTDDPQAITFLNEYYRQPNQELFDRHGIFYTSHVDPF